MIEENNASSGAVESSAQQSQALNAFDKMDIAKKLKNI